MALPRCWLTRLVASPLVGPRIRFGRSSGGYSRDVGERYSGGQRDQILVPPVRRLPGNRSALFSRFTAVFAVRSHSGGGVGLPASVSCGAVHTPPSSSSGHATRATLKGTSMDAEVGRTTGTAASSDRRGVARRLSTETKAAYKTTEFLTYVVVFAGILLASFLVKTGQDGQRL